MADKVRVPILIVLILFSLFLTAGVFYLLQKERAKNLGLQEELEEIRTKERITETKLQESKNTISALEVKLQEAKDSIDKLTHDLEQEKAAKEEAQLKIEQLKTDLENQQSSRSDLEKKLTQAQKDVQDMQNQLKELESRKTELETEIKDLEVKLQQAELQQTQSKGVELGKIVVSPEGANPQQTTGEGVNKEQQKETNIAPLEGKILVINKDYNFVVINLGSKDGVAIGDIFSVYHNNKNKYLGDIKVEKVHDSMAAAEFVSEQMKDKINEGDKIIQKTK